MILGWSRSDRTQWASGSASSDFAGTSNTAVPPCRQSSGPRHDDDIWSDVQTSDQARKKKGTLVDQALPRLCFDKAAPARPSPTREKLGLLADIEGQCQRALAASPEHWNNCSRPSRHKVGIDALLHPPTYLVASCEELLCMTSGRPARDERDNSCNGG